MGGVNIKRVLKVSVIAVLFFSAASTHAKIYKCTLANGKLNFQDTPCIDGSAEEVSLKKTNVMDENEQVTQTQNDIRTTEPKAKQKPMQDPLTSQNQMMCESATRSYEQEAAQIKARCKKGRETFCDLPAEEIQRRWDNNYLKRESGDSFSPPTQQWHAFNRNGGAPIYNLKSQISQYCKN